MSIALHCDGVVVRASASQSVDLEFIPLVKSYENTLKNGIHSFPARRSAFRGGCGQGTKRDASTFMWKTDGPDFPPKRGLMAGKASDRKKTAML